MEQCEKSHGRRKYYTPSQVNAILPDIKRTIKHIHELRNQLETLDNLEILCEGCGSNIMEHNIKMNKQHHKLSYEFFLQLEFLQNLGCEITDLDDDLIDFYSVFEGREIMLCWKHDEEQLEHWHEVGRGFAARKPISILPDEQIDVQAEK